MRKTIEILVCNRLLSSQPLYHVEYWANCAPIKEIYGIDASLLNDDRLAKTLDAIHGSLGVIKSEVALHVAQVL